MSLYTHFDHFNVPLGDDGTPYGHYEALRDEAAETGRPIGWSEVYGGYWVVTGWDEARAIALDTTTFSNTGATFPHYGTPDDRPIMLVEHDEPAHKTYRRLVQAPFSPQRAADVVDGLRANTSEMIDRFIADGRIDLPEALTNEIPARLTALYLGLPPDDGPRYRSWTHAMGHLVHTDPPAAATYLAEMEEYFGELLQRRRREPGHDVLSMVIDAEVDGERLSDEEIKDFFVVLLLAGIDNMSLILASMFWRLGWDHELRRRLVDDPSLLTPASDEFLRFYSPAMAGRKVMQPVEVAGVRMEVGQQVLLVYPIANRDRRQFDTPDTFVPERTPNRHLALGLGIHRCLGAHLVRVEMEAVAQEFMRRIPDWELAQDAAPRWQCGLVAGMVEVPIVFPKGGGTAVGRRTMPVG
jgi:hypothetical protein